jgi:hypothetical protein
LRGVGVPVEDARETVGELLSDLVAENQGQAPLLAQFHGQCALETWINRAALSRAISRRRSEARYRRRLENARTAMLVDSRSGGAIPSDNLLRDLLREAIQKALADCPGDDFVIIHLLFGTNLHATEIARMFQCDRRTLSQRAEVACSEVRFAVQAELRRRDPWLNLSWSEIVTFLTADLPPLFEHSDESGA